MVERRTDYSRLVNLLVEFEEKLEKPINKKYRPFIRQVGSLGTSVVKTESLSKSIRTDQPKVGRELILFKLGLESKEKKCVVLSLQYLLVFKM
jgi:hypothetical protein